MVKKTAAVIAVASLTFGLAACSSAGGDNEKYVVTNTTEPQNPFIPGSTNEVAGGNIMDLLNSALVYYDSDGKNHNELAESIEPENDGKVYKITLKDGITFEDGAPIKAENFVKAWNYIVENDMKQSSYFEAIQGYESGKKLEGLKVVDDKTFTVELKQPEADFPQRLGYTAFVPLPDSAFDDINAFGEKPIASGPYKLESWNHQESIVLVPNDKYKGDRKAQNSGINFKIYSQNDAAYSDLLAGNLDVIDAVPLSAYGTYKQELGSRAVSQPNATFQGFTIPQKLEHFNGEEGKLRRRAISMAINRDEIIQKIFDGTRTAATDFTAPTINGWPESLKGDEVTKYNPEKAKELWAQADAMSPFSGEFTIAYNADYPHKDWVDATMNSIKNTLGIQAEGKAYPDFKSLRDDITKHTISGAYRSGWAADYPSMADFLIPSFATGGSSNDGDYSNPDFDKKMKEAAGAPSIEESFPLYHEAEEILLQDLPAIPMWYSNTTGGSKESVDNVVYSWRGYPDYYKITKK